MTLYPTWLINLGRKLIMASDWIDDTFFPVLEEPDRWELQRKAQAHAERDANHIRKCIASCRKLRQINNMPSMIRNYKQRHGSTVQVNANIDSMKLDMLNKVKEILNSI